MKRRKDYKGFDKVCQNCKKTYTDVKQRRFKFCSLKCWKEKISSKRQYVCKYCGCKWITNPNRNTKYCSRKCMFLDFKGRKRPPEVGLKISTSKLNGKMPSKGKKLRRLKRWIVIRKQILKRDGFMCQMCFCGGIEVHHIKPTRDFPELAFNKDNLITLCKKCHTKTYCKEKEWEDYFKKKLGMV